MTSLQSATVFCLALLSLGDSARISAEREKRVISLFNVISFKQDQCSAQESERLGTCLTADECSSQKGTASGNCASGFGVCCIFTVTSCMGDVSQNCTNVQNPGFPTNFETDNMVAGPTCTYNIKRIDGNGDICQIRLDFQTRTTLEVTAATGVCVDPLTVTNSMTTTASAFPPTICGQLSGQHIYFDSGSTGDAGRINIVTGASNFARSWNIKVTYIECANALRAPDGCHQYFTGASGTVSSFNHQGGSQLAQMRTRSCIRQEEGMCTIQWSPALGGTPDSFFLSDAAIAATVAAGCTTAAVAIPDNVPVCGGILSTVAATTIDTSISSSSPFSIRHITVTPTAGTFGFKLCYTQMACSN